MFLFYDRRICTHSIDPSLAHGEFPGLGLALVGLPDVVVPEVEHGVHMKQESRFNFCPGRDLNLGTRSLMAANVTTRLRRTTIGEKSRGEIINFPKQGGNVAF